MRLPGLVESATYAHATVTDISTMAGLADLAGMQGMGRKVRRLAVARAQPVDPVVVKRAPGS